jgi:hypothetical protein
VRQGGTIDALRAEHVDVVELGKLFRRECFGRPERHVTGVVNDDVQTAAVGQDLLDARFSRCFAGHVQLDGTQIDPVLRGVLLHFFDLRRVTAGGFAHAGVDRVSGMGERAGGEGAKATGGASDDDDLFHDGIPQSE